MRTCTKCGRTLPESEFYSHRGRLDTQCKDCQKAAMKAWREANREHVRAYDAARAMTPKRVEARRQYRATPGGRSVRRAMRIRWETGHRQAVRAENRARYAREVGRLKPEPCISCGATEDIVGHHPDYSQPLSVVWLCRRCHSVLHAEHARSMRDLRLPAAPRCLQATEKDRQ